MVLEYDKIENKFVVELIFISEVVGFVREFDV